MIEGLFISIIGMATVFVVLTIIMFLMVGIQRLFRAEGGAVEEAVVAEGAWTGSVPEPESSAGPEDAVEVAAIALALASHMEKLGRQLGASPISIGGLQYQVEVGDLSRSPVSVVVNGERCWACLDGEGLPVAAGIAPRLAAQTRDAERIRLWRSAYPLTQSGYWDRRGWAGRDRGA